MVSHYNAVLIQMALAHLDIDMQELMRRSHAFVYPSCASALRERRVTDDYREFQNGVCPPYVTEFCEHLSLKLKEPNADVRSIKARRSGIVDINAYRLKHKPKR